MNAKAFTLVWVKIDLIMFKSWMMSLDFPWIFQSHLHQLLNFNGAVSVFDLIVQNYGLYSKFCSWASCTKTFVYYIPSWNYFCVGRLTSHYLVVPRHSAGKRLYLVNCVFRIMALFSYIICFNNSYLNASMP